MFSILILIARLCFNRYVKVPTEGFRIGRALCMLFILLIDCAITAFIIAKLWEIF